MSVYTRLDATQLQDLLTDYAIGELEDFTGISAGVTNTNYFVDTTLGRWVLTLFEQSEPDELPFFMQLMDHLAAHGVPGAHPVARNDGGFLSHVGGRPAALVYRLDGASTDTPSPAQCGALGGVVAEMHRAVNGFAPRQRNPRDLSWIEEAAGRLREVLAAPERRFLDEELGFQRDVACRQFRDLPRAVIHADLFRDNVLFRDNRVAGVIDFYYACHECLLFDLAAICCDWAYSDATFLAAHWEAFIAAYARRRAPTEAEHAAWPAMLRAVALRFWVSRLVDLHFPMRGHDVQVHDPAPFARLLERFRQAPPALGPA
ncbi:homoserine kinase [Salinisphaera sp. Q1T1-3]|uniref:homoserine kinase n=1 Tax=Salinisphaera sp. Q1T1-3 TaxID=2321229 RepID=UPI000E74BC29|nr:homoserine kinase [Salinisphaera sp. Q1T1-3]RJS91247.1 homoserine kinase [Salinisphaera sp. Q1T1-3]